MTYLNNYFKTLVLITTTALIFGCGGGDGDGGDNGGSSSTPAASPAPTTSLTVRDLSIAAENNLESVYEVEVDVDISAISTEKAFISICDNSLANGDLTKLDFNMCLVKSSLVEGKGHFDLRVANHCDELIAVIWIMEKGRAPLTYTLSHNNQKETYWTIN